jgi:uncharacterized protein (TIGR03000 family)
MGRTCPACQRINPQDARFCHFDGTNLAVIEAPPTAGQLEAPPPRPAAVPAAYTTAAPPAAGQLGAQPRAEPQGRHDPTPRKAGRRRTTAVAGQPLRTVPQGPPAPAAAPAVPEGVPAPCVAPAPAEAPAAAADEAPAVPSSRPARGRRNLSVARGIAAAALLAVAAGVAGQYLWRTPGAGPSSAASPVPRPSQLGRSWPNPDDGPGSVAPPLAAPPPAAPPPPARAAAPRAPAADPPAGQAGDSVEQAVARGVAYLRRYLRTQDLGRPARGPGFPAGTPPTPGNGTLWEDKPYGERALAALALVECGVPGDDILVKETAAEVRSATHPHSTWSLAWSMQLLDRLGDRADEPVLRSRALRLVAGQTARGNWSHVCPPLRPEEEEALLAYLELAQRGGRLSPQEQARQAKREELWDRLRHDNETLHAALHHAGYDRAVRDGDLASSRFAVLGLNVARRHGLPVRPVLARAAAHLRRYQHEDGSWWSTEQAGAGARRRADMTCVGLLGLAAGPMPDKANDPAVTNGIRFLDQALAALQPPPPGQFPRPFTNTLLGAEAEDDLQFLWSLDEVAARYGLDTLGGREWAAWVRPLLVAAQQPDGSWRDRFGGPVDTCYALLVLRHALLRNRLGRGADPDSSPTAPQGTDGGRYSADSSPGAASPTTPSVPRTVDAVPSTPADTTAPTDARVPDSPAVGVTSPTTPSAPRTLDPKPASSTPLVPRTVDQVPWSPTTPARPGVLVLDPSKSSGKDAKPDPTASLPHPGSRPPPPGQPFNSPHAHPGAMDRPGHVVVVGGGPVVSSNRPRSSPDHSSPTTPAVPPTTDPVPSAVTDTAHIDVRVPAAAEVWVEGVKMKQTGSVRRFVSPPLTPGQALTYDIRARWTDENGQRVDRTRHVPVQAGAHVVADFTPAGGE